MAPHKSAADEAREEAGVVGAVSHEPIGSYGYRKRLKTGKVVRCDVQVFPLKVKRQVRNWLEKGQRDIRWFSLRKAIKVVREPALRKIIRRLPKGAL
jgi:8-oxo-dGTP pyrophosphatase MutT (NUDIX family)